jgi:hypothetical protein
VILVLTNSEPSTCEQEAFMPAVIEKPSQFHAAIVAALRDARLGLNVSELSLPDRCELLAQQARRHSETLNQLTLAAATQQQAEQNKRLPLSSSFRPANKTITGC